MKADNLATTKFVDFPTKRETEWPVFKDCVINSVLGQGKAFVALQSCSSGV